MPISAIKRDIKKHRPIDWFAIAILISVAFVLASALANSIRQFEDDMELEARRAQVDISNIGR